MFRKHHNANTTFENTQKMSELYDVCMYIIIIIGVPFKITFFSTTYRVSNEKLSNQLPSII